jgi:hypothetical protein
VRRVEFDQLACIRRADGGGGGGGPSDEAG